MQNKMSDLERLRRIALALAGAEDGPWTLSGPTECGSGDMKKNGSGEAVNTDLYYASFAASPRHAPPVTINVTMRVEYTLDRPGSPSASAVVAELLAEAERLLAAKREETGRFLSVLTRAT